MGYLHEGHLSLVDLVRGRAGFVAASIFVNPLQFGKGEDLARYPRDLDRDLVLLKGRGIDLVFHPSVEEMYPGGEPSITVDPGPMGDVLCGKYRPGHFRGVLTVVARLFGLFQPDLAGFGQKDYQQSVLIRRMARDLDQGVEILVGPVIRGEDGLALSSRNIFLTDEERRTALGLSRALRKVQEAFSGGTEETEALRNTLLEAISGEPGLDLQYGEILDPNTLKACDLVQAGFATVVAAHCGSTRLIDNHILTD